MFEIISWLRGVFKLLRGSVGVGWFGGSGCRFCWLIM